MAPYQKQLPYSQVVKAHQVSLPLYKRNSSIFCFRTYHRQPSAGAFPREDINAASVDVTREENVLLQAQRLPVKPVY